MRLGEIAVRSAVMALVLTGQMLPAGSVSAQEGPMPPSAASPDQISAPKLEATVPPAAPLPEKLDEEAAAAPVKEATQPIEGAAQTPPTAPASPIPAGADLPAGAHQVGDWTITIRPGIVTARSIQHAPAPCDPVAPTPPSIAPAPVTIHVNQIANTPYQSPWMWSVPATYSTRWSAPTSAYLFQRPRPYWKLRGDFHHLSPFIAGYYW